MKKTLQEQYLLIKEGKGHKDVFVKEAKRLFPNMVRNAATFKEPSDVLKSKQIIKENIVDITYGLASVMAMRPVEYDFCEWYNPALGDKTRLGFIAQEVKAVVPEVVNIATDPRSFIFKADDDTDVVETHETIEDMHSIEELQIIPILVKAIQELKAEVDALKG